MRKTREITITNKDSRDFGKSFLITEMPALQAERWARHGLAAFVRGADMPDDLENAGMAAWASLAIRAIGNMPEEAADRMWDQLLACVKIKVDAMPAGRPLILDQEDGNDIEEPTTIAKLRMEAFDLHTGFLTTAAPYLGQIMDNIKRMAAANMSGSPTSPSPSGSSSAAD